MNMTRRWLLALTFCMMMATGLAGWAGEAACAQPGYRVLHCFTSDTDDGSVPWGTPTLVGSTLYGLAAGGGEGAGVLFRIGTDGSGFSLLHVFANDLGPQSGTTPRGSLTLDGSMLYGFTAYGGENAVGGTVFRTSLDGSAYQVLISLQNTSWINGHRHPYGAPILAGNMLYGITQDDNTSLLGSLFAMSTDGQSGQLLHEFVGKPGDGSIPAASPILSGNTLYGMTTYGGPNGIEGGGAGYGTIYAVNTDGTGYRILHEFAGFPNDGNKPCGPLLLVGSTLYGMTSGGGKDNSSGVLFSIGTDGTGYTVLFDFNGAGTAGPLGGLILLGNRLYGMTSGGCPGGGSGAIFQINLDGTGFHILHCFLPAEGDGGAPRGDLVSSGGVFYGLTAAAGCGGSWGVVFSLRQPSQPPYNLLILE